MEESNVSNDLQRDDVNYINNEYNTSNIIKDEESPILTESTIHNEDGVVIMAGPTQGLPPNASGIQLTEEQLQTLQPNQTWSERFRDRLLLILDNKFFTVLNIIVILLVIADGAFFFFLLIGWQRMCRPRTDCDPRNYWYNWSIQVLNILFTYMVTVSLPWRFTNLLHTTGYNTPKRKNDVGHNLYGYPTDEIFYSIPLKRRTGILVIFVWNALFQYMNQGTRIKFNTFATQNVFPGNLWTNIFFVLSFLFAFIAAVWMFYEFAQLRKQPGGVAKYGIGPISALRQAIQQFKQQRNDKKLYKKESTVATTIITTSPPEEPIPVEN